MIKIAYNATYTADDASPMVIDFGLGILAAAIGFVTLIGLLLVYNWFKKKTPKL